MRGGEVTLSDIVLKEVEREPPEPVSLTCDEEIEDSEEEEEPSAPYKVVVPCPLCKRALRLWCRADRPSIQALHQLLLDNLEFLCGACGRSNYQDG